MQFYFYPRHEFACPQVGHCPHLGGAALGTLVHAASENHDYLTMLHGQLDAERQRNSALVQENETLTQQIAQLKLELNVERQSKFADSSRKEPSSPPPSNGDGAASHAQPKKRGAPVSHPGCFRPALTRFDKLVELAAPATLIGFEKLLATNAEPLVEDIAKKIGSSDGAVHAVETYWRLNGGTAYFWVHGTENYIHFQCDTSRSGQVSRDVLGKYFDGVLVTDCYPGYEAHTARATQKCLAHLARTARDWQKVVPPDSTACAFFEAVKTWVTRGCRLQRNRQQLSADESAQEKAWIRAELERLVTCPLDHD